MEYHAKYMSTQDFVIKAIADIVNIPQEKVTLETKLGDIAHDSIKLFELFIRLENELKGSLSYEEVMHIESVGDVIRFVESHGGILQKE